MCPSIISAAFAFWMVKFALEQQVQNFVSLIVSSFTMTEVKFAVMFSTVAQLYILNNLINDREMLSSCPASFSEYNHEWLFLYYSGHFLH